MAKTWNWPTTGRTSSREHRAWRTAVLERDQHTCRLRGPRCTVHATHADHITPVAFGGAEFDLSNGQAACPTCHREKSQREAVEGRRRAAATAPRARRPPEQHPGLL